MDRKEHHGYFTAGECDLYGCLHRPVAPAAAHAALLLPAFGEERKAVYRWLVRLARKLALRGHGALRLDLSGTGESAGAHRDATLSQWVRDARAGLDLARDELDCREWMAVGVRLGANLALRLAAQQGATRIVLVEPILRGPDYLRDLTRRQQIKDMMSGTEAGGRLAPPSVRWQAGEAVDFGGFEVGALLANELEELDLEADLAALPEECCVQLLRVSGATKFPPAWESVAGMLQRRDGCLAEAIRDRPFWGQVEYFESDTVMDAVIAFLCPNESVPAEP